MPYERGAPREVGEVVAVPASLGAVRPQGPPPVELSYLRGVGDYTVWRLALPSSGENRQPGLQVTGRYYRHRLRGRRGLVVVLPIWGRSAYPPAITARRITRYGDLNVLVLDGIETLFDWQGIAEAPDPEAFRAVMERSAASFAATVTDVRRLLDWAVTRPEIDPSRLGITGFSISAIVAATTMGVDGRLSRGVLVMGGGDLAHIFSVCPKRPGRVRERYLATVGWSPQRFRSELDPILGPVDPLRFAAAVDPSQVLFIDAGRDACIPMEARETLWRRLGRPERVTIEGGHRGSFLAMTFLDNYRATKRIARFFRGWPDGKGRPEPVVAAGSE